MAAHLKSVVYPIHWMRLMICIVEWRWRGWEC